MVTIIEREFEEPLGPGEKEVVQVAYSEAVSEGRDPVRECKRAVRYVWLASKRDVPGAEPQVREARPARMRTAGGKAEKDHAKALADRIARLGNAHPLVLEARGRLGLPAKGLAPPDALALLRSPLLRFATVQDLARWKVPVLGHRADIESERPDKVAIRVTRKGGKQVVRFGGFTLDVGVEFENERRQREGVMVSRFSVLGDLAWVAERLAYTHPFKALWTTRFGAKPACLWLVLTGRVPPIPPVEVLRETPGSVDVITIHALARVASASTVAAAFSEMQKRILGHRKGRKFAPRSFDVVAFVEREVGGPIDRLDQRSWGRLVRRWNESHRPRERFSHVKHLRDTYRRAAESLF